MTLVAAVAACITASILQNWIQPYLGLAPSAAISLVYMLVSFYFLRRWLAGLRGD